MRFTARVEPTRHVISMVEFAEEILRLARDRGLSAARRKYRRRSKTKGKANKLGPKPKKGSKKNPLSEVEE